MDGQRPSHGAVPGLSFLAMRHEDIPVAADEATDVFIPTVETTPPTTPIHDQVVEC